MDLRTFLTKHPIPLTDAERQLCDEAIEIMKRAEDVHHDHTHIYRLLDSLDEFMSSSDFKTIESSVDLRIIFISMVCHDLWRSRKDAHTTLQLLWYMFLENVGGPADFWKLAKKYNIDSGLSKKIAYCIKKHTQFVIFPLKTIESKIVKAVDELDIYSDERIALLEKKFLLDRPITRYYLKQARFAVRLYLKSDTTSTHFFPFIESTILEKKHAVIERLNAEIDEYTVLLEHKNRSDHEGYRRQLEIMKQKFNLS